MICRRTRWCSNNVMRDQSGVCRQIYFCTYIGGICIALVIDIDLKRVLLSRHHTCCGYSSTCFWLMQCVQRGGATTMVLILYTSPVLPYLKVTAVWSFVILLLLVFGRLNFAISTPVLFCKFGVRVPLVRIDELKKSVAVLPA